jgi:uncharacterized protein YoxC
MTVGVGSTETLLVILIVVISAAFVLQCLSVWAASRKVGRIADNLQKQTEGLAAQMEEVTGGVREVVESLRPLNQVAKDVQNNADALSRMVRERAEDFDQFAREMVQAGRDQAAKIDYLVTDTVKKFEQVTEVIQKDVVHPALEITSFIKGIQSGLGYLFTKKTSRPEEGLPEEEMFI